MNKLLSVLLLTLSLSNAFAALCDQNLDSFPVLNRGRVKPYIVFAQETIRSITGKTSFNNMNAQKITCILSQESIGIEHNVELPIRIDHIDVKKLLNLNKAQDNKTILAKTAIGFKDLIRSEIMQLKEDNSYKKALNRLWFKIDTYQKLVAGTLWKISGVKGQEQVWDDLKDKFKNINSTQMYESLIFAKKAYIKDHGDKFLLEVKFTKSHIFSIAMALALLGIFLTVLVKKPTIGLSLAVLTVLVEAAGITIRVIISGRAPITNMYETVLFSGFGALVIALIVFLFKKDKIFILGGLGYNILCLFMMKFSVGMLDSAISPLVPVLRDNFWLSTHVTTIMLSYAALALSWLLANITLAKQRFGNLNNKEYRYYEELIYTSVKIGIVLLATGIILGGVWADYSWGRFWGWDPKETWSLIVLLFYIAILHGKNTTWITTHRFIVLTAGGFMTVMMAWFGVNYILATGLHSYGFSEGGALFLGGFFLTQIIYLFITGFRKKSKMTTS